MAVLPRPRNLTARLLQVALAAALAGSLLGVPGSGAAEGDGWAIDPSPNASANQHNFLNAVTCLTPSDCWAVGYHRLESASYQPLVLHWDGLSWDLVPVPSPDPTLAAHLYGVTCATESDCWAVGYHWTGSVYEPLILRWDGTAWSLTAVPADDHPTGQAYRYLYGVTCPAMSDCWAVGFRTVPPTGREALILRWDGSAWSAVTAPSTYPRGASLVSVDCVSATDCWSAGYTQGAPADRTLTMHWDGTAWSVVDSPNTDQRQSNKLSGVRCTSTSDCWAVGTHLTSANQTLILRWNGEVWTVVPSPNAGVDRANTLFGVACTSAADCWAVGYHKPGNSLQTLILRWDGASWAIATSPNTSPGQTNTLRAVACVGGSGCAAVGNYYNAQSTSRTLAMRAADPPAAFHGPGAVVVTDAAGDANLLNAQGSGGDLGVATAPASIDSADLREIGFETTYESVAEFDATGAVRFVRHVPTGLRLRVVTTAPARPTVGPTVTIRVPASVGPACKVWFTIYVRGDQPGAVDREGAEVLPQAGCDAAPSATGIALTFDGNATVATFPFESSRGLLADGTRLWAWANPSMRVAAGSGGQELLTAPAIDEARVLSDFVVGSDVPPDIDCATSPTHPACQP